MRVRICGRAFGVRFRVQVAAGSWTELVRSRLELDHGSTILAFLPVVVQVGIGARACFRVVVRRARAIVRRVSVLILWESFL